MWIKPDNEVADWKCAGIKRMNFEGTLKGKKAAQELHERYGHISYNTLRTLPEYPKEAGKEKIRCKACEQGKATKPSAPKQPQDLIGSPLEDPTSQTRTRRLQPSIHRRLGEGLTQRGRSLVPPQRDTHRRIHRHHKHSNRRSISLVEDSELDARGWSPTQKAPEVPK